MMLEENHTVNFEMITDYWKDTGTPDDIIHANGEVLKNMQPYFLGTKQDETKLVGKIMIGNDSNLSKNTKIFGPCIIGKNCTIGENCTLDNVVVDHDSIVPDNTVLSKTQWPLVE